MPMKVKKFKVARRLGAPIFDQCASPRFDASKRRTKSGRPARVSDYGKQLIEKQKVRFTYGVSEKQFRNYVDKAIAKRSNISPAESLFKMLESRIDNVVYRAKLAPTRRAARQLVSHGHFTVNGTRITVPSYALQPKDVAAVREGSKNSVYFKKEFTDTGAAQWLTVKPAELTITVSGDPKNPDPFLDFQSVVEFYSR